MPLLTVEGLSKSFTLHRVGRHIKGCQDIGFSLEMGECVGITGRSGSGKSTILRCIWRTNLPEQGRMLYDSAHFRPCRSGAGHAASDAVPARVRTGLRLPVPQRAAASERLRHRAESALETYGADRREKAEEETEAMLRHFDLDEDLWQLYPRTFLAARICV